MDSPLTSIPYSSPPLLYDIRKSSSAGCPARGKNKESDLRFFPHTEYQLTLVAEFKAALGRSLTPLIQNLSQVNMQLAGTLQYWQKHYHLQDEIIADSMDLFNNVDLGTLSFQENVLDNEPTCTRSGLYIYLNANVGRR